MRHSSKFILHTFGICRYGSREGMVAAAFNYIADLLFAYCTEEPDMAAIYGAQALQPVRERPVRAG